MAALVCATAVGCGSGATAATDPAPPSAPSAPSVQAPSAPAPAAAPAPSAPSTPPPAPAPSATCKPEGKVLFEIDHKTIPDAHLATSTTKVYVDTAWTREDVDADGKAQPVHGGCFAKADYQQLADTLHAASWKITTAQVRCMAMSSEYTVFLVDGKQVFTRKLCSGQSLDQNSQAKLDQANTMVDNELKK